MCFVCVVGCDWGGGEGVVREGVNVLAFFGGDSERRSEGFGVFGFWFFFFKFVDLLKYLSTLFFSELLQWKG